MNMSQSDRQALDAMATELPKFIEDSVDEALSDPSSRQGLLSEADCAIRVLKKSLLREEDKTKLAQFMLLDISDQCFVKIADEHSPDPSKKLRDALERVLLARELFGSR